MEQKKTLWIITAAGFFLAVVILFALIFNQKGASNVPSTASITMIPSSVSTPVVEKQDSIQEDSLSALDSSTVDNLVAVDEKKDGTEASESALENAAVSTNSDGSVTIDLNQVSEQNTSVTAQNQTAYDAMQAKKQTEKPSTIYTATPAGKTAEEKTAEKKAATYNAYAQTGSKNGSAKTSSTAGASAKTSPSYVEATKYWVQCASYTSKKSADNARSSLDESRIPAEVFTYKDGKNNLYYRVRVGPYTTKSEAEYWKNRICQLDSFKNSQSYITMN